MKKVFVSYSLRDALWTERLFEHLRPLAGSGRIQFSSDADIAPGEPWESALERSISSADGFIVVLSASYLGSEFLAEHELPSLVEVAKQRSAPIFPLLVSPVVPPASLRLFQLADQGAAALSTMPHAEQEKLLAGFVEHLRVWATPAGDEQQPAEDLDLYARAMESAVRNVGGIAGFNLLGNANIFVEAERMLQRDLLHGDR